ncbi:MAG TPA: DNA topoisomerase 3 [Solirubrobacteraceae bacterium]|nr:DNA topoisomerase 3 [Solirubrobacteraceae bacterium]
MGKTLIIAEKPSVGRDLARVLPGPFEKKRSGSEKTERWLEGPDHVITWAVGHLVQLAEPDEYDERFKKWRMADLPIVPDRFRLVVRDERSQKQMDVVSRQLRRDDVDLVVNACDAGREGELIFAYLYEKAKARKPVKRLWLSSMTEEAMREALAQRRDGSERALLEDAARSPSAADWIVGMNATRAATIRLRSSFDGAVSLGRVQTPTLAILTRREEEIRAFVPERYWLVDAKFETSDPAHPARRYEGRYHAPKAHLESRNRIATAQEAQAIADAVRDGAGEITKLTKRESRDQAKPLYDLTSLQRDANNRFGFSARRTLAAAQRLYEEHKALTYPRTNSRWLPGDMASEIKPIAGMVGRHPEYASAAAYVRDLDVLPLARVVDDAKVTDHHAIVPTNAEHRLERMGSDDRRVYDLVVRRFLAIFHPEAVFENTTVETTVAGHVFRTTGKVLIEPGWRAVYGESADDGAQADDDEAREQTLPRLEQGERVRTREAQSLEKQTKPPGRYSDASLLGVMETAGKLVSDDALREAMKESGIGTPATRAAIIERLIDVGYVERDGRSLVPTEKGMNVIRLLGEHPLTSPSLTGEWEHRLAAIEEGQDSRKAFMADIAKFAGATVGELDARLKDVRIPRANLGPCAVCGRDIVENRKGYSCWSREDPGCGFVIWKAKAGKQLPAAVARELIQTGRTARPVTGFKGRSGRSFRARLALMQNEEGRWRVEFDEPWAREGAKPPEAEEEAAAATAAGAEAAA